MGYQVRFVSDNSLPEVEWAFVRTPDETYLIVKQSAINTTTGQCDALSQAWEVWQRMEIAARPLALHDRWLPVGA